MLNQRPGFCRAVFVCESEALGAPLHAALIIEGARWNISWINELWMGGLFARTAKRGIDQPKSS